ncbi:MAG: phosphoribosylanthranilate isomerase [Clostridia bacterium]|nr:phosphoribosylanthranilate isomerase [Clostridia bacterium]
MKIKICGLRRQSDIEAVNTYLPDYIGFVFVKDRKRYIAPETAAALRRRLTPRITPVGVFLDNSTEEILTCVDCGAIEIIQLHGSEDDAFIAQLRKKTDKKIIKAFKINSADDLQAADASAADMILLDSGEGSGRTFCWQLLKGFDRPYFLAGGLSPDNIADAIDAIAPYGVDVSSGVETDGDKDEQKIQAFISICRQKEHQ